LIHALDNVHGLPTL